MSTRTHFKKTHGGFPAVVYVKRKEDGTKKYFVCGEEPDQLPFSIGESAEVARYTFADHVHAKAVIKLGDDDA